MSNSITELMSTDPLSLSYQDITAIVEHFRKNRHSFNTTTAKTKTIPASKKLLAAENAAKALGLDLDGITL